MNCLNVTIGTSRYMSCVVHNDIQDEVADTINLRGHRNLQFDKEIVNFLEMIQSGLKADVSILGVVLSRQRW